MTVTADPVEKIVNAVLYEGYILYPYRTSAIKNRVRWTFGGVHPRAYSEENGSTEPWQMRTQCLLLAEPACQVDVEVRFLHLLERRVRDGAIWQEATEQRVVAAGVDPIAIARSPSRLPVVFAADGTQDEEGSREWRALEADVEMAAEDAGPGATRLTITIANGTPVPPGLSREEAMLHSLVSAHTVLRVGGGRFVSLTDPPPDLAEAAAGCHNAGTWPVLVGEPGSADTMLSSPIILEDYPRIADESPDDLFDSTEIDELLTLRILSLTEAEKEEVRRGDDRARQMLQRAESRTPSDLMRMHGTLRGVRQVDE